MNFFKKKDDNKNTEIIYNTLLSKHITIDNENNKLLFNNCTVEGYGYNNGYIIYDTNNELSFDKILSKDDYSITIMIKCTDTIKSNTTDLESISKIISNECFGFNNNYYFNFKRPIEWDVIDYNMYYLNVEFYKVFKYYIIEDNNQYLENKCRIKRDLLEIRNVQIKSIKSAIEVFNEIKPYYLIETEEECQDYISKKCNIEDWCFLKVCKLLKDYGHGEAFYEFAFNIKNMDQYNKLKSLLEELQDPSVLYLALCRNFSDKRR